MNVTAKTVLRAASDRSRVLAVVLVMAAWAGMAGPATHAARAAATRWSGPQLVDRSSGVGMYGQGCTPDGHCFGIDDAGRLVSYAGTAHGPGRVIVAPGAVPSPDPANMACPSQTQCTIITQEHEIETFDPSDPSAAPAPVMLPTGNEASALACPSSARCVATDASGEAVSFDPTDPAAGTVVSASGRPLTELSLRQLACPTASQCTALGSGGTGPPVAVTFDPTRPASGTTTTFAAPWLNATDLACVSPALCVAVGLASDYSSEVVVPFDPHGTTAPAPRSIAAHGLTGTGGLVCPRAGSCALFVSDGSVLTFDPATGPGQRTVVDRPSGPSNSPPSPVGLDAPQCIAVTRCVAVDGAGFAVTVDPAHPAAAARALVDPGAPLSGLTCRTRSLCLVTGHGEQGLFSLPRPGRTTFHRLVTGAQSNAQCPQPHLCVVVAGNAEQTFTPGRHVRRQAAHRIMNGTGPSKIPVQLRCPGARECVVLYAGPVGINVVSFDPQRGQVIRRNHYEVSDAQALACPSTTQCTVLGQLGDVQTFDPANNHRISTVASIDRSVRRSNADNGQQVNALACESIRTCVAVDTLGNEVVFDPHSRKVGTAFPIDPRADLSTIACAAGRCTAGDGDGNVLTGTPRSRHWSATHLQLAGRITGISCPDGRACVASDNVGHLYETTNR